MSGERVVRRLAAILAADVVGYSRLMGADEEGTLAALKVIRRELGDPKVKEHRGRIVKTTGDAGRHLRLGHSPRPYRRPAPLRLRGPGRAERQEHRSAGAGLCVASGS